jgi:hypothetical protein
LQSARGFDQEPEQHGAIVIDKFDEAGFHDEAAQFD